MDKTFSFSPLLKHWAGIRCQLFISDSCYLGALVGWTSALAVVSTSKEIKWKIWFKTCTYLRRAFIWAVCCANWRQKEKWKPFDQIMHLLDGISRRTEAKTQNTRRIFSQNNASSTKGNHFPSVKVTESHRGCGQRLVKQKPPLSWA